MAPDGSGARQLTTSPVDKTRVAWFPSGEALLVSAQQGRPLRVPRAGGDPEEIPLPFDPASDAVVSPSGTEIAVSHSPAESRDDHEIFLFPVVGGEPRRLTEAPRTQHEPVWDPTGAWIYFLSRETGLGHHLSRITPDGRRREALTSGDVLHFDIAIGPLGSIAFSADRSGNYEIWLGETVASVRQLTDHPALDAAPSFSPDEREIVFESARSGRPEIWKISTTGGPPEQITQTPGGARRPVWWWPTPAGEKP